MATITAALPSHLRLHRDGFAHAAYLRLRFADRVRTTASVCSAGLPVVLTFAPRRPAAETPTLSGGGAWAFGVC